MFTRTTYRQASVPMHNFSNTAIPCLRVIYIKKKQLTLYQTFLNVWRICFLFCTFLLNILVYNKLSTTSLEFKVKRKRVLPG